MKKIRLVICVVLSLALLCACGHSKPANTSDAMYQIGLNALKTADDYMAGKLSGEEAYIKIQEYVAQANAQYDRELSDTKGKTLINTEYSNDPAILFDIVSLSHYIMSAKHGSGTMSDVRKGREELAASLGK